MSANGPAVIHRSPCVGEEGGNGLGSLFFNIINSDVGRYGN
jgi:hypothetical protein